MFVRFLTIAFVAITLSACSSTDDQQSDILIDSTQREDISQGPLQGTEIYGDGVDSFGSAIPGSQEDLAVNVGDRIFFDTDRFDLGPEARRILDRQADWMNRYPNVNVTVEGHADERGTREYNLALGERRASSVKNYLISMGVDPRRVNTISYGKEQPAVLGSNPASWAQNRRGVSRVE